MAEQVYLFGTKIANTDYFCRPKQHESVYLDNIFVEAENFGDALRKYADEIEYNEGVNIDISSILFPLLATATAEDAPEGRLVLYGTKNTKDVLGNNFEHAIVLEVGVATINFFDDKEIKNYRNKINRIGAIANAVFDPYDERVEGGPMFAPLNGANISAYAMPKQESGIEIPDSDDRKMFAIKIDGKWIEFLYDFDPDFGENSRKVFHNYIIKSRIDETLWEIVECDGYIAVTDGEKQTNICCPDKRLHIILRHAARRAKDLVYFVYQD